MAVATAEATGDENAARRVIEEMGRIIEAEISLLGAGAVKDTVFEDPASVMERHFYS